MKFEDLSGLKFNNLLVLNLDNTKVKRKYWICKCDCNNIISVSATHLKNGHTKSCGCLRKNKIKNYNNYNLNRNYGIGFTGKNEVFYFDLEDYNIIFNYYWRKDKNGYIVTNINKMPTYMHQLILNVPEVDHINHIKYDNRKYNLRSCTHQENMMNQTIRKNNSSGVTGITWDKLNNNWRVRIYVKGKQINLGSYLDLNEAILQRKKAEQTYFKEYANTKEGELL